MKKALVGVMLLLAAGCGVCAQEQATAQAPGECGSELQREFGVAGDVVSGERGGEFRAGQCGGRGERGANPNAATGNPGGKAQIRFFWRPGRLPVAVGSGRGVLPV